jgi:Protein of unknown function (DUF732)
MKRNLRILTVAAWASIAAAIVCAPAAAATPETFLDELHWNNVWLPNKTPGEVIGAGYATCGHLRGGTTVLDEMTSVEQAYQFNQGALFVSAATTNLCPDFAG